MRRGAVPTTRPQRADAGEVLELGAQWSIRAGDVAAFERYMAQLKVYYYDLVAALPPSPLAKQLIGLDLLRLLAQNKLVQFHTMLERLDPRDLHANVYIRVRRARITSPPVAGLRGAWPASRRSIL